jgi:hypothetical protein
MKKILLSIVFAAFILGTAFSQSSFEIYFEDQLLEPDQEITIGGEASSSAIVLDAIDVKNITSSSKAVKCAREDITIIPGTSNSFCWGLCYPPTTDTSAVSVDIDAGGMYTEFSGDYYPDGNEGASTIKYTYFDELNPSDKISVLVVYSTLVGIDDPVDYKLSAAYPNPANNFVKFDYDISEISDNSKVVIYNLLGSAVKEVRIDNSFGSLKINTSDFNEGIYFYSLVVNNEPTKTQKLIIKH